MKYHIICDRAVTTSSCGYKVRAVGSNITVIDIVFIYHYH